MTSSSAVVFAACTALLLLSAFNQRDQESEGESSMCTSNACLKAATSIMEKLDRTVNPCKDFYQFACGSFLRKYTLPENTNVLSIIELMENEVLQTINKQLESPRKVTDSDSLYKAKMLYETCMNSDSLEDNSIRVLRQYLSEKGVGDWPVLDSTWSKKVINVEWRLAMLFVHHVPTFFHMYSDSSFSPGYMLNLYPAGSLLKTTDINNANPSQGRLFEAYHKLLLETLRLLGVPEERIQQDIFDMIGFELQFSTVANVSQWCVYFQGNDTHPRDLVSYRTTLSELEKTVPQIKWTKLMTYIFRNLGIQIEIMELPVMVHCERYLRKLGILLTNTPARTLANYLSWKFVLGYMTFMSTPFRQIYHDYTMQTPELLHPKIKVYNARWKGCVSLVDSWLNTAIASLYADREFGERHEIEVQRMISSLKKSLGDTFSSSGWLEEDTIEILKEKLEAMKEEIGYPRYLLNPEHVESFYARLDISNDSLLRNMMKLSRFLVYNELQKLTQPKDEHYGDIESSYKGPLQVNAYYFATKNTLVLPLGILKSPMFDIGQPKYLNYGQLGVTVAHEITHGFDTIGLQYDKAGNTKRLWVNETDEEARFWSKARCFVDQYARYPIDMVNQNVDGDKTLHENIADGGGLRQSFKAYQRYIKENGDEPHLPGISFTNDQLFFIHYGQMRCEVRNKEGFMEYVGDATSSVLQTPAKHRVNGVLSNFDEFARIFNCPPGSPMNPTKKCILW